MRSSIIVELNALEKASRVGRYKWICVGGKNETKTGNIPTIVCKQQSVQNTKKKMKANTPFW
jgi:hypothetical protein